MKRDMDLVRSLLLYLEEKADDQMADIVIEGYDEFTIGYHLILLYEAGLLEGEPSVSSTSKRVIRVHPMRLTWQGHDFLAAARNDTIWQKTKAKAASEAGDVPFALLKDLLIQTARAYVGL
ncbi:MAG: DUF2513 domain-containing protein [Candidatus Rokubacteria bacterium]|nr:DUF2513 domain-containing protein [Candidatus Rokubacteria bacterium]